VGESAGESKTRIVTSFQRKENPVARAAGMLTRCERLGESLMSMKPSLDLSVDISLPIKQLCTASKGKG
jgi:hypothetical protein